VRFTELDVAGAYLVELEPIQDDRGLFARAFCAREFEEHGLQPAIAQANLSANEKRGTLRGLHYQSAPAGEAKLFRCIQGATFHVIVDLRADSPTHGRHVGVELSAANRRALYVPEYCATGYQALADGAEVLYTVSGFYSPEHEGGIRYDDPLLDIEWPIPVSSISEKDASWPLLDRDRQRRVR
jgi:dTDP-4-dehydrorhamnose 3,5-epimerase